MPIKLSFEEINSVLHYERETGILYWRERVIRDGPNARLDKGWNTRYKGKPIAKRVHRHGHLQVGIRGQNYMVHRLIWILHYGTDPVESIDHIDGDPANNTLSNLRLATQSQNMANASTRIDNTSGIRGVSWSKRDNKWYSYINKDRKMYSLGKYSSFEEACSVRRSAEIEFFGEFMRKY